MDYKIKEETLVSIADAIRSGTGSEEKIKPEDMPSAINNGQQRVFDAGKKAERDAFWDVYMPENRRSYLYAFAGEGWDDTNYNPPRDIIVTYNAQYMYRDSKITNTKKAINASSSALTNFGNVFTNAKKLQVIELLKISEITKMDIFSGCTSLKRITISGTIGKAVNFADCPLEKDVIEHIVEHLSDTTTNLSCTFNASAIATNFTNEEWIALKQTKSNWKFTPETI